MTDRFHAAIAVVICALTAAAAAQPKPRARDLGIAPGVHMPGPLNAITDVDGVRVGHTTVIEGDRVRTGVTAVVPHAGNVFQEKVAGAVFVGNAFGKLAGSTQVNELGTIETPIVLTNTLSVGTAMEAVVRYTMAQPGNEAVRSVNALVGETNDGGLNDIRGLHVTREHVIEAIRSAKGGAVAEGSSRRRHRHGLLRMEGRHRHVVSQARPSTAQGERAYTRRRSRADQLRREPDDRRRPDLQASAAAEAAPAPAGPKRERRRTGPACSWSPPTRRSMHAISAVSPRAPSSASPGRDPPTATAAAISRSPSPPRPRCAAVSDDASARARTILPTDAISPLFEAALEATEEAVYNSLFQATTVRSANGTVEAIPVDRVRELLRK